MTIINLVYSGFLIFEKLILVVSSRTFNLSKELDGFRNVLDFCFHLNNPSCQLFANQFNPLKTGARYGCN